MNTHCDNPLFALQTQHQPLPFATVKAEHFQPALEAALAEGRERLDALASRPEPASFENTIEALETIDEWADRISATFHHLLGADGDEHIQALSNELSPMLSAFRSDVNLNTSLFQRVNTVYQERDQHDYTTEQATLLENMYQSFARNGALLDDDKKETLREIDERLSLCAPKFSQNLLHVTQAYELWVTDPADVEGLPASALAVARAEAEKKDRPNDWKFTLDAPSYIAFVTYSPNANLRKELWTAFAQRCLHGEHSNLDLIRETLELREQRAQLLGYADHASFVLERRMAGSKEAVFDFLNQLVPACLPAAKRDLEDVRTLKEQESGEQELNPWDYAYYCERLKRRTFDLDDEELRPYFEYNQTLKAVMEVTRRLFGLLYTETDTLPVYANDVRTFDVRTEAGEDIGTLLVDPHPRPTKRGGAWMADLLGQGHWGGEPRRPLIAVVANVTPPTDDQPALLTFNEASTMFHEFGHAIHGLLSQCTYRSVAGTNVFWDFVELPSQILENWLSDPEALTSIATHYKTGKAMPPELIEKIKASRNFQKGYQSIRQLSFGLLDMTWHTTPTQDIGDLVEFEKQATESTRLFPVQPDTAGSPAFQHIFAGGYSAGYYSYKWAEVLEADAFEAFQENGIFDQATADRFRECILEKGGSDHPMTLYKAFRGREPDPQALLRRDGLM